MRVLGREGASSCVARAAARRRFSALDNARDVIVNHFNARGLLKTILQQVQAPRYSAEQIGVANLRHMLYKSSSSQYSATCFGPPYSLSQRCGPPGLSPWPWATAPTTRLLTARARLYSRPLQRRFLEVQWGAGGETCRTVGWQSKPNPCGFSVRRRCQNFRDSHCV